MRSTLQDSVGMGAEVFLIRSGKCGKRNRRRLLEDL